MRQCFLSAEDPVRISMQAHSKNAVLEQGYPPDQFPAGTTGAIILVGQAVISCNFSRWQKAPVLEKSMN